MGDPLSLVGHTLAGKYRIDRVIGEGGYGVVYAATHLVIGQPVAVKCMKTLAGAGDEAARDAFLKEARVLFELSHPGIVRLYDAGIEACAAGNVPYAVLELLDGVPLDAEIATRKRERRPMHAAEIARVLDPVLDAVAFAHARGVVHRDLKPSNVMLTPAGPKVLDFGTARIGVASRTTGVAAFTPMYAAPEQWNPDRFGKTSARTDVFALGLVLAEMATLAPPFVASGVADLVAASADPEKRPRLAAARPDLPPALDALVLHATRPDPRERFADAAEMRDALAQALAPRARAGLVVAIGGVVALALAFAGVWFGVRAAVGKRARPPAPPASMSAPAPVAPPPPSSEEVMVPSATTSAPPARPAPRARLARAQLVDVTGKDFDRSALEEVYRAHADDVARCGGRAFARDPSLATIDAWLQLSPSGDRGCHADAEGSARAEMCACLLTAAVGWRMPQPASPWILQTKPTADFHVRVTAE